MMPANLERTTQLLETIAVALAVGDYDALPKLWLELWLADEATADWLIDTLEGYR